MLSPRSAADRTLSAELRRLRQEIGRTVADVARELSWSESKLSRMETCLNRVRESDLNRLLQLYRVPDAQRVRLVELARQSFEPRSLPEQGASDAYARYLACEANANAISAYGSSLVPGLLQTAEYAAATLQMNSHADANFPFRSLAARIGRQAVLARVPPPSFDIVLDESVLHRPIGGTDVLRRQLLRLRELGERPTTTIQVLPFAVGVHPAVTGHFALVETSDATAQVFCDGLTGGVLRHKPSEVAQYRRCFEAIQLLALDAEESMRLIVATAEAIGSRHPPSELRLPRAADSTRERTR